MGDILACLDVQQRTDDHRRAPGQQKEMLLKMKQQYVKDIAHDYRFPSSSPGNGQEISLQVRLALIFLHLPIRDEGKNRPPVLVP